MSKLNEYLHKINEDLGFVTTDKHSAEFVLTELLNKIKKNGLKSDTGFLKHIKSVRDKFGLKDFVKNKARELKLDPRIIRVISEDIETEENRVIDIITEFINTNKSINKFNLREFEQMLNENIG